MNLTSKFHSDERLLEVEELDWVSEDYLETNRCNRDILALLGKDDEGERWARITLGWFFADNWEGEVATYWEYYINSKGEIFLLLDRMGDCIEFPLLEFEDDLTMARVVALLKAIIREKAGIKVEW